MTGAESMLRSLLESGVDTCFANPGTSEIHFVASIDRVGGMRPVLCLFEGVATGAADGFARMADRPAATLLHLGPGLANGLANLHDARRALSPIVNIVGEHTISHRQFDAPLTSDIEGFARPVSAFVRTVRDVTEAGRDTAQAVAAARSAPGVATLIVPADISWSQGGAVAGPAAISIPSEVGPERILAAAEALRTARRPAILMSGRVLRGVSLEHAGRVAAATGARLYCDFFAPRIDRGAGLVPVRRIPYFGERVIEELAGTDLLVLIEADAPVSFFGYPNSPSELTPPGTRLLQLARRSENGPGALAALAEAFPSGAQAPRQPLARPAIPAGALTVSSAAAVIAALLPEHSIVVDESCTSGMAVQPSCQGAAPHVWLAHTGGALGLGLPMATGAAIASPGRRTLCLLGDGSAMYTVQALWTAARENLDVVAIVFANRAYSIINHELKRVGASSGPAALSMMDLARPELRFVDLARGMGVEGSRAESAAAFASQLSSALIARGPRLIELALAQ
jgi:acetolactate synthase-1/2/3 large subunit